MKRVSWLALLSAFACLDDIELPPLEPVLLPIISPVRTPTLLLQGTKPPDTGILLGDQEVVKVSGAEVWTHEIELEPGTNKLAVRTVSKSGLKSVGAAKATVVFEPDFPAQPTLDGVASPTNVDTQTLSGLKPKRTSIVVLFLATDEEQELVPLDQEESWSAPITLTTQGPNLLALVARDDRGRDSEPVDFVIDYDVTAPIIVSKYPEGDVQAPTNSAISVSFDGPLAFETQAIPAAVVSVRNGGTVLETDTVPWVYTFSYQTLSRALRIRPQPSWPANTTLTVTLRFQQVADVAGNVHATAQPDWIWTFTTGAADDLTAPPAPTITDPVGDNIEVFTSTAHLAGTKPSGTAVLVNGEEVIGVNAATDWQVDWPLPIDAATTLDVGLMTVTEQFGPTVSRTFTRRVVRPNPPVLDPQPPDEVDEPSVQLGGTRDPNTSVLLNGVVVVPRSSDTAWAYNAQLVPGLNVLRLQAKSVQDGIEVLSDPVEVAVTFKQVFSGNVPGNFALVVSYGLRNLDNVQPIRGEFETGPSNYSVDIWLEGPLDEGETCTFNDASKERSNVKYAATLVHYKGEKAGHTNPWADEDYANADYVAALVTAGVLDFAPDVDRRDDGSGLPGQALTGGGSRVQISQEQVDTTIDGVTQATQKPGQKLVTWPPAGEDAVRFDGDALRQGEYVLHLVINLDRSGAWITQNDEETCWGDAEFSGKGAHRISARLGLGDVPFGLPIGQAAEEAGPDAEDGKDALRFLTNAGVQLIWAPL